MNGPTVTFDRIGAYCDACDNTGKLDYGNGFEPCRACARRRADSVDSPLNGSTRHLSLLPLGDRSDPADDRSVTGEEPGDDSGPRSGDSDTNAIGKSVLPPPTDPMAVARCLLASYRHHHELTPDGPPLDEGTLKRRYWGGSWMEWKGAAWAEIEDGLVRQAIYEATEHARYLTGEGMREKLVAWAPNRRKVSDVSDAMASIAFLESTVRSPSWIGRTDGPCPIIACANGLLDLTSRQLLDHDPRFFNHTAVPFDYNPNAPEPTEWLKFLHQLWPSDQESIQALQEWFGYVISGRLDLHKILLLIGPPRAGKGVISRVLGKLVGPDNVAGPTMSSLAQDFGLAPLLGKTLAEIADARLGAGNAHVVVERLLSISGGDVLTVNRKYKQHWTGCLPVRFMVISNELPHLGDASGAIAGRFVTLQVTKSFLGEEDLELEDRLARELSGILNWSLDGLDRLTAKGRFTSPASSEDAAIALMDLTSPVGAFVRDEIVRSGEVGFQAVFKAWEVWAHDHGYRPGNAQTFGRDLRAVIPGLKVSRPRDVGGRERCYVGISLRNPVWP